MADQKWRELVFRSDPLNEQQVIAAQLASPEYRKEFAERHPPDVFLVPEHQQIQKAIKEAVRKELAADPATLSRLSGGQVDSAYLAELMRARPDAPARKTFAYWVEQLLGDKQRHTALTGPIASLLESLEKGEEISRVRGLARAVSTSFDGMGDREHLLDPERVVAEQVEDVRKRMSGRAVYPFGVPGLDLYDVGDPKNRRMIPAAAPGLITVVTGISGAGKTTVTARITLGLARLRRKVLYGAWEMKGGVTLELLACLSLGWKRTDLMVGNLDEAGLELLRSRMTEISRYVRFLANPFRRRAGEKGKSNERNLDLVQGYIADSGCSVFVADLWKRCLANAAPEEEEEALYRQQAMAEELDVHCILVQQQRLKDIEARPDKRPTREGIKGSGAWVEVADNIIGVHRPALWKPVTDDSLEIDVLKQRYGKWPLAIEFAWDPDRGSIEGGKPVEYDVTASGGKGGNPVDQIAVKEKKGKWGAR